MLVNMYVGMYCILPQKYITTCAVHFNRVVSSCITGKVYIVNIYCVHSVMAVYNI